MDNFNLDNKTYNELLNFLNNQHFIEKLGSQIDLDFLTDDWWLRDTAVIENVVKRAGMWEIHLVFAHYKQPQKLIKRIITSFSNKQKAELNAWYMKRLAAKDQRGTLKVDLDNFKLCSN